MPDTQLKPQLDTLTRAIDVLQAHTGAMHAWTKKMVREIPKVVDEKNYNPNATQVNVTPQSANLELIQTALITCSSTGGMLQVGTRVIPVGIGTTIWYNLRWFVDVSDIRQLTQTTAGIMGLELMGEEYPTKGPF